MDIVWEDEIDKAVWVFDFIVDMGLKPNIISYGSLINGYCKKGRVDEAWLLFFSKLWVRVWSIMHVYRLPLYMDYYLVKDRFADGCKLFKDLDYLSVCRNIFWLVGWFVHEWEDYAKWENSLCQEGSMEKAFES